jgi:nucleoside-diphosphate kinase
LDLDEIRKRLHQQNPEGFEQTLVLVKPDGVALGIHPAVAALYQAHEFHIVAEKRVRFDPVLAFCFYSKHEGSPYFRPMLEFLTSGDSKAYVLLGFAAAARAQKLQGATDPRDAEPASMRGLFCGRFDPDKPWANLVHASDDLAGAVREIELLFGKYPL